MTWRIAIRHSSLYSYESPVSASYNEVRMTPVATDSQVVLEVGLSVTPAAACLRYLDYWSTVVHAFDIQIPHKELYVVSHSLVDTAEQSRFFSEITWEDLGSEAIRDRYVEFLTPTIATPLDESLGAIAAELAKGILPYMAAEAVVAWVRSVMRYEPGTTGVSTSAVEAWIQGSGVCQDFAHLSLVLLRYLGIPARYISGYLHPQPGADTKTVLGASHAWVEAWLGRWMPLDPTNEERVGERHIVVARGRDYSDVPPFLGVYHGGSLEQLEVIVELTRVA